MFVVSEQCLLFFVWAGKEVSYALLRDGAVVMWGEHSATLRPRPFPYVVRSLAFLFSLFLMFRCESLLVVSLFHPSSFVLLLFYGYIRFSSWSFNIVFILWVSAQRRRGDSELGGGRPALCRDGRARTRLDVGRRYVPPPSLSLSVSLSVSFSPPFVSSPYPSCTVYPLWLVLCPLVIVVFHSFST